MFSKAQKRHRDIDIAAMQRYRWNPYKEALLNPISGPLVGVPTTVPVDTYRVRIKAQANFDIIGGAGCIFANPFAALCNDPVPVSPLVPGLHGAAILLGNTTITNTAVAAQVLSNAPFARAQFAGVDPAVPNVRGRVVSACLRVCNITADATKNGVFTAFTDPAHNTLQGLTAADVRKQPKSRMYNACGNEWITMLYHPVEPDEVDGWVWDPRIGPQGGVKTIGANPGGIGDNTPADTQPGFMGIWWNGQAVDQQLLVELHIIAEYVGPLVQQSMRENEARITDALEARHAVENNNTFSVSGLRGDGHTGHSSSATR